MKRPAVVLSAAGLFLLAAITLVKGRPREEHPGIATGRGATAGQARTREFWEVFRQATDQRIAGNPDRAAGLYARALELDPQHEDALYYLGNVYLELGRYAEAETAWDRLVAVNPGSSRAHSRLGDVYFCAARGAKVDLTRAEAEFRRAHEINREETGPLLHLGEIALVRGNLADARYYLDAVIGANGGSVEAHFLQGYAAWRGGDSSQALALFGRALELARSSETGAGVPGEGDTERGRAVLIAPQAPCGVVRAHVADLSAAAAGSEVSAQLQARYHRLSEAYEELRRARP